MVELKKSIGFYTIVALTIVSLMGSSIFFGVSVGAGISGSASLISWLLVGIIAIYVAFCFGELISMFPNAGGTYEFAKQTYGRFPSFVIGWMTWIVGNITTALLVISAVEFILPGAEMSLKIGISVVIILILNYIAFKGIDASSKLLIIFGIITLLTIILVILPGLLHMKATNYQPYTLGGTLSENIILILFTIFFIIESFFGWESASFMAEETINAERVVPRALIIATIISVCLGILLTVVTIGVLGINNVIGADIPFLDVANLLFGSFGVEVFKIAIIATLIGAAAGGIISGPRLLLALGRDKLFIEQFSHIHKKRGTPVNAIIFQTFLSIVFVLLAYGEYRMMLGFLVPLALLMYIPVLLAVVVLRYKKPELHRTVRAPGGKVLPFLVITFYIAIIIAWAMNEASGWHNLRILGAFLLFAVPIYLLLTFYYNPSAIILINNAFSRINYWLEDILLPKKMRKHIMSIFQEMREKTILEFGCGVGTLTVNIAEEVGPQGKVIALDLSEKNLKILKKRMFDKKIKHVETIHDEHMINRIHPDVKRVDMVISVGHLSYIQDLEKVLKELYTILPDSGRILFVEYIDYFYFLPNKAIISNQEELKKVFKRAGFSVNITTKNNLLWKFIFIYGIKTGEEDVPVI